MPDRDIIAIGASQGGIEPLRRILSLLPADLPATLFVVIHQSPEGAGLLAEVLDRQSVLRVRTAENGEEFRRGRVYVAPPDRHLLVESTRIYLTRGPKENRMRPAIDPLFRTAAAAHGAAVIGVILSGALDDGTAGLAAVKRAGGTAVVQDPNDAIDPSMPRSAIDQVEIDEVRPAAEIAAVLTDLAFTPVEQRAGLPAIETREETQLQNQVSEPEQLDRVGNMVPVACPECGGQLWEMKGEPPLRFRCFTGHTFSAQHLANGLSVEAEHSLWAAVRLMEERKRMLIRMAGEQDEKGHPAFAKRFRDSSSEAGRHAEQIKSILQDL